MSMTHETEEHRRLHQERERIVRWKQWGPYLAERAWGTVREDYSATGDAWNYFPHDHARSRVYRWNEDGLAGICDRHQNLIIALALWNGHDSILKERLFGVSGPEGNHGEDVKEIYFYEDATPTSSYLRFSYKYPQKRFPYEEIVEGNRQRSGNDPELEPWDIGLYDDGKYFDVVVEYAKRSPQDILMIVTVHNRGAEDAPIHILPHIWFRNTWSWDEVVVAPPELREGERGLDYVSIRGHHRDIGPIHFYIDGDDTQLLFTNNESNHERLFGSHSRTPYVKDAFHERVVHGNESSVNPHRIGSKAAAWRSFRVPARGSVVLRARLCPAVESGPFDGFDEMLAKRRHEADEFYLAIQGPDMPADRRLIQRQASAGLFWSMQFYHYDVDQWLRGDAIAPPESRLRGRNKDFRHISVADVISMPDKWEYPWFAAWDLSFHALAIAPVDIDLAKNQLKLLVKEWYQHPNGQIPAYEWEFGDLNPPVLAWAAHQLYKIERKQRGRGDRLFLERIFHKLLINFAWWVNKRDVEGNNVFEGGFLGLDNISVFDRSETPPPGVKLEQADATAWMAMYCIDLMRIALELALENSAYEDCASKFFEHFLRIAYTFHHAEAPEIPLWNEDEGFYFDILTVHGTPHHVPVRSLVGLIPLFAIHVIGPEVYHKLDNFRRRMDWFLEKNPHLAEALVKRPDGRYILTAVPPDKLERVLGHLFDEREFMSLFGPRSLSKEHATNPVVLWQNEKRLEVSYEPGESNQRMKGGNSNWRGPIWFPTGYMLYRSLLRLYHGFGDTLLVPGTPTQEPRTLHQAAREIAERLVSIFERGPDGRRPVHGPRNLFQYDEHFHDKLLFFEYFHGDTGEGLGASHQTGWTGLVGDLALRLERYRRGR